MALGKDKYGAVGAGKVHSVPMGAREGGKETWALRERKEKVGWGVLSIRGITDEKHRKRSKWSAS